MELRASLEIIQRVSGEILEESSEFDDSPAEELANSLTHGFGLLLSAIGFVFLVVLSSLRGTAWHIVSFTVYGASLVLCYGASTLYHSLRAPDWKQLFHKLDHAAIFVLIAGTYTPFLLVSLRGPWGWSMFGIVWSLGLAGVVFKLMYADRFQAGSATRLERFSICGDGCGITMQSGIRSRSPAASVISYPSCFSFCRTPWLESGSLMSDIRGRMSVR